MPHNVLRRYTAMKIRRLILSVISSLLVILWIAFIFSNSAKSATVSDGHSSKVVEFIVENVLQEQSEEIGTEGMQFINHIVRKCAHFVEFAILSFLICFSFLFWNIKKNIARLLPAVISFFIACCDECIQYFVPGRACRLTDVLIDTSGAVSALLIFLFVINLYYKYRSSRGENE